MNDKKLAMPEIVYGTAWKKEQTSDYVSMALTQGFRGFDTACQPRHYREDLVGEALNDAWQKGLVTREQCYIQTKFTSEGGQDPESIPYDPRTTLAEQVQQSFEKSLANLRTSYVDALVLHSPIDPEGTLEVWEAMEQLHKDSRVGQLGMSNCYDLKTFEDLYQHAKIKPAILQNRFYRQTQFDNHLRAFCRRKGIRYQSFWSLTANPDFLESPLCQEMVQKHNKTPAQILFRFLMQWEITPLTGTTNEQHMRQDLEVTDFTLSETEFKVLESWFL